MNQLEINNYTSHRIQIFFLAEPSISRKREEQKKILLLSPFTAYIQEPDRRFHNFGALKSGGRRS